MLHLILKVAHLVQEYKDLECLISCVDDSIHQIQNVSLRLFSLNVILHLSCCHIYFMTMSMDKKQLPGCTVVLILAMIELPTKFLKSDMWFLILHWNIDSLISFQSSLIQDYWQCVVCKLQPLTHFHRIMLLKLCC
jgi:hypothetical protein